MQAKTEQNQINYMILNLRGTKQEQIEYDQNLI